MVLDEHEREKRRKIMRKSHTKDIFGMEPASKARGSIDQSARISQQTPFKGAIQQIKDFRAGLFLLDFVDKIVCEEDPSGLDLHESWDKCTVSFRGREQEFFDINTILTDEHRVKSIKSTDGAFLIDFKEPTSVELYTWKGSLIDLNPHDIKKVIMNKKVTAKQRKKVAYRMRFTNLAKKGEISDYL